MTFHYYDIIIRPLDPEIEIDFDVHGFSLFLAHFAYVHFGSKNDLRLINRPVKGFLVSHPVIDRHPLRY